MFPILILLLAAAAAEPAAMEIVVGNAELSTELRLKTDRVRNLPGGGTEPVYTLRRAEAGTLFATVRVYIANEGAAFPVGRDGFELLDAAGTVYPPVDWFSEEGMGQTRADSAWIGERTVLGITAAVPEERVEEGLRVRILDFDLVVPGAAYPVGSDAPGAKERVRPADPERVSFLVDGVTLLREIRIQTETFRRGDGGVLQPVYRLQKPGRGSVFVNVRVFALSETEPTLLRRDQLAVRLGSDRTLAPVDWYREDGLVEERGEPLRLGGKDILEVVFEVPESSLAEAALVFVDRELGTVNGLLGDKGRR